MYPILGVQMVFCIGRMRNELKRKGNKRKNEAVCEILFIVTPATISPAGIYLPKVNNWKTRTRSKICSKLTIKTPEQRHWLRSGVFIINFEHVNVSWVVKIRRTKIHFHRFRTVIITETIVRFSKRDNFQGLHFFFTSVYVDFWKIFQPSNFKTTERIKMIYQTLSTFPEQTIVFTLEIKLG